MYMSFFEVWFLAVSIGILTALLNRRYYIKKIKTLSISNQQHTDSKTSKKENISS